jgi:hypothetical protein
VGKNLSLVSRLNVFIVRGLTGLHIDPANVEIAALEFPVKVLDITHDPGHFNAAFDGKLTVSLHLPVRARATSGSDFSKSGDDEDFIQIEEAL